MKRIFAVLLTVAMTLTLVACGGNSSGNKVIKIGVDRKSVV